jgi:competence protein ComEA
VPSPEGSDELARQRLAALGLSRPGWVPDQTGMFPTEVAPPPPAPAPRDAAPADLLSRMRAFDVTASGRALLGLAAVCGCLLLVTAWALFRSHGTAAAPAPASAPLPVAALPSPTPSGLVIDVGGRVRRPGLVTLPAGSRVADAVRAAGGALRRRDLATINLAAKVSDGQLLLIGMSSGDAAGAGATAGTPGPVSLNSATVDQLDELPGIGPVLAQRIVDWRTQHGGFKSVRDLDQVSGIGDTIYAELEPLVTV